MTIPSFTGLQTALSGLEAAQAAITEPRADAARALRFLRWQIEHEHAVRAGLLHLQAEALDAERVHEVEIGVEDDGDLRLLPDGLQDFQ